jgi:hypothetical protein
MVIFRNPSFIPFDSLLFFFSSALLTSVSWPEYGNGVLYTDGHNAVKCALLQSICNENVVSKRVTEHGFAIWVRIHKAAL